MDIVTCPEDTSPTSQADVIGAHEEKEPEETDDEAVIDPELSYLNNEDRHRAIRHRQKKSLSSRHMRRRIMNRR